MTKENQMTLNELIERLEELRDDYDVPGNTTIRGAFQPNYPLVARINAVTTFSSEDTAESAIYIALGDGNDYGSRDMWEDEIVYRDEEDEDEN